MRKDQKDIYERAREIGRYVVESGTTVREAAKKFGIGKSTCHKDLQQKLPEYDLELAKKVQRVLKQNKATWYVRGGQATKNKYAIKSGKKVS